MMERAKKSKSRLKLDWKGAQEDMKEQYISVELQHQIQEWQGD
jgi:hypothetical protein